MLSSPLTALPLMAALLFVIFGIPAVYRFTDARLAKPLRLPAFATPSGAPTRVGLLVHALVVALVYYWYLRQYDGGSSTLY